LVWWQPKKSFAELGSESAKIHFDGIPWQNDCYRDNCSQWKQTALVFGRQRNNQIMLQTVWLNIGFDFVAKQDKIDMESEDGE
jgi:hypothetical protein